MKKLLLIAMFLLTASAFAQAPSGTSYQAIIRNESNELILQQNIEIQISILRDNISGLPVYREVHNTMTNSNGLISIEIGNGTPIMGDYSTISWGTGSYFIKTETDPTGGSNYSIFGISEILSVPYALHANTANSIVGGINENDPDFNASAAAGINASDIIHWDNHTVDTDTHLDAAGVTALGFSSGAHTTDTDTQLDSAGVAALGYIAGPRTTDTHINATGITALGFTGGAHTVDTDTHLDANGIIALGFTSGAHIVDTDTHIDSAGIAALGFVTGLASTSNVFSTGVDSAMGGYIFYVTPDGKHGLVVAFQDQSSGEESYSADDVINDPSNHDANGKGFTDWRLPTKKELLMLYNNRAIIGGFGTHKYWSSTSRNSTQSYSYNFGNGSQGHCVRNHNHAVRVVRSF